VSAPPIYVAIRTADLPSPYVRSQRMACSDCAEKVWIDPVVFALLKLRHPSLRVLCDHCVKEAVA
jgi:hypothetical protein